jgi:oligopeptidase B
MSSSKPSQPKPPKPQRKPTQTTLHGVTIVDDFAWLKADNWREVLTHPRSLPENIHDYLTDENTYTEARLRSARPLWRELMAEMRARIDENEASAPAQDGPYLYWERHIAGSEHPQICRRRADKPEGENDTILLDADEMGKDKPFFDLGDSAHSPDHALLAWSADETGSEFYSIYVRDIATNRNLEKPIEGTDGSIIWCKDSLGFYYILLDANHRPSKVMRHRLGTKSKNDILILEATDSGHFIDIDETMSGEFCLISVSDHETSEEWLVDLNDPAAAARVIAKRRPDVRYSTEHRGDELFISTNADGAEDSKIVIAPLSTPSPEYWRELVPHRKGVMIVSHLLLAQYLIRVEREEARPRIVVRDLSSHAEHTIAFDEDCYSLWLDPGYIFDTTVLRFGYSSMTRPDETYDYDLKSRQRTLIKREIVPSGHDPEHYFSKRIMARSHDGAMVPISLLMRKDTPLDGSAPCLLYGYGSYGTSISANFRSNPLSLVDRGFIYAIAHIRGGSEKGWHWYLDGKREKKTNTFKDYIAAAEALCAQSYTQSGRIVAHGISAGGMLMGAVANLAPQLFAGIVAEVPFVDVLHTMLDGDLPLTPPEWPEWGNPGTDPEAFRTIVGYSPYENVRPQAYPAILAIGGLTDPRVTYWEPAKWVAKLRATMTGGGPVMLRTNMTAGHGGASGRFARLDEVALVFAFAIRAIEGFKPRRRNVTEMTALKPPLLSPNT